MFYVYKWCGYAILCLLLYFHCLCVTNNNQHITSHHIAFLYIFCIQNVCRFGARMSCDPIVSIFSLILRLWESLYNTTWCEKKRNKMKKKIRVRFEFSIRWRGWTFTVHFFQLYYLDEYHKVWVWKCLGEKQKENDMVFTSIMSAWLQIVSVQGIFLILYC